MILFKIKQIIHLLNISTQDITNKTVNNLNVKSKRQFQHFVILESCLLSSVFDKIQYPDQYLNSAKILYRSWPSVIIVVIMSII